MEKEKRELSEYKGRKGQYETGGRGRKGSGERRGTRGRGRHGLVTA